MIAVTVKVVPAPGQRDRYQDIAAFLKGHLVSIPGFISIERFQSLASADKVRTIAFPHTPARQFAPPHAAVPDRDGGLRRRASSQPHATAMPG